LRKAPPTLKVRTSFSIVASGATELSACASFAEVEMRRPEGEGNRAMATGSLKMWNAVRGFGFIKDDSGGPDIFLHVTAVQSAGVDPDDLRIGELLTFDVESTRDGKTKASNVRRSG
jgi:cold shock protein